MTAPTSEEALLSKVLPVTIPKAWKWENQSCKVGSVVVSARSFVSNTGLTVFASVDTLSDGRRWLHLSISRRDRLPSWKDLRDSKNLFIGAEKTAIQLLPKESAYIDAHPFTLHLWHCLEGPTAGPWG